MNDFTNTTARQPETADDNRTASKSYCAKCSMEPVAAEGDICPQCVETTKTSEVNALLEKNGITREDVSVARPLTQQLDMIAYQSRARGVDINIECRKKMQCEFDELTASTADEFITHLLSLPIVDQKPATEIPVNLDTPEIERSREAKRQAAVHTAAAAQTTAKDLVPEFGTMMAKREPNAIAFGFPPAVALLIDKAKLSPEQTEHLLGQFRNLFGQLNNWREQVDAIVITDENDLIGIEKAKEIYKAMSSDRINSKKKKDILAEPYLRPKQLIDGVFKIYLDEETPIEQAALTKARTKELAEQARREKIRAEREEQIAPFVENVKVFDLLNMTDEAFDILLSSQKELHAARAEQKRRDDEEHQRRDDEAAAERVKLRRQSERRTELSSIGFTRDNENNRYVLEDLTVYDNDIEGESDSTWAARINTLKPKAEAIRVELKRKKDEADKVIADRQEADRLANDAQARAAREKEAAELAPDKVKLEKLADAIKEFALFESQNERINDILGEVRGGLTAVEMKLRSQTRQLP